MFTQNAVFFEYPFPGPSEGKTVRFFDSVGPFRPHQSGEVWTIFDSRKANERGGPDRGTDFGSREEAEAFVRANL